MCGAKRMTEDDIFNVLRRSPYELLYFEWCDHIIDDQEEWAEGYGWKFDDFIQKLISRMKRGMTI